MKAEKIFCLRCKIFFTRNILHDVQIIILHTVYPNNYNYSNLLVIFKCRNQIINDHIEMFNGKN